MTHPLLMGLICALTLAGCAVAPLKPAERVPGDYAYTREYTSWLVTREMRKHDVAGLSIAIVDDQQIVWAQGFGFADVAKDIAADARTIYHVGSISKLFTTTGAMQLVERGRLDVDQPVHTYLPGFSIKSRFEWGEPITVRQLMTHHSGLPRDILKGMWTAEPEPFTYILDFLRDEQAAYPPDTIFSYSNVGMTLLGHVVQNVSGREFASHLAESLLQPLGMSDAYFATGFRGDNHDSKGYREGVEVPATPLRDVPAGGLHASVSDLSKFMMMVLAGGRAGDRQIVKPETLHEMLRPQNTNVPLDLDFRVGLGWILSGLGDINIRNAGPVLHHSGGTPLFHSQLILLPEHKLGVVVLANSASARAAVDRVATEALKLALESKTGITQPTGAQWTAAGDAVPAETLRGFQGYYTTLLGAANVELRGSRLQAEALDQTFSMVPRDEGWFGLRYQLFGFIPISLAELDRYAVRRTSLSGREVLIASDGSTQLLIGERLTAKTIPETWRQRTGRYEIVNPGQDELLFEEPSLTIRDGFLRLLIKMHPGGEAVDMVVEPLSDTEAIVNAAPTGYGETIQVVEDDGVELWRYSGYLFRRK